MKLRFSIYSFITQVRKDNWDLTPDELTKLVLRELPPECEREALEQCLRIVVANSVTRGSTRRPYLQSVPPPGPTRSGHDAPESPRQAASRRRWKTYLEDPFHVVPGSKTWFRFGDCTVEDLRQAAEKRDDLADALRATAGVLREWADLLTRYGVTRVRDLPEDLLRQRIDRRPAA